MKSNAKIDVEKMLAETPAAAPPEDLLEKLRAEIPEELPKPAVMVPAPSRGWMKVAAALLLAGAAGLIGYRVTLDSERPDAVELPPATDREPLTKTRVTEGGPAGSVVREEAPVGKEKPAVAKQTREAAAKAPSNETLSPPPSAPAKRVVGERAAEPLAPVTQKVVVTGEAPLVELDRKAASSSVEGGVPGGVVGGIAGGTGPGFTTSARAPIAAPSTGGTREPNDAPYGDVFFKEYGTNPFVDTDDDRLSTFGLDVDTGSYTVARRYLTDGNLPPREAIRVEEFVNAFSYGDRPPARGDFAIRAEAAPTPFMKGDLYRVVRFNVRGRVVDEKDRKPAVLTFVVDVSGSMRMENRLELVKRALGLLLDELKSSDRVGLVVYGSEARRILDPTADREAIRDAIDRLVPEGSTNAEQGLRMGYEMAARFRSRDGINRVVLCSDGVANVGRTGPASILQLIEREARENDIELTTVGFGMGNYNDVLMEQLANKGDGRYAYVDTLEEARRIFVEELTGTLQTIAADAKIQVEFDPSVVARWRLIGYENRDIADERFRDDSVDAGEIGAGHSVTALYEIKLKEDASRRGTAATVRLRYRSKETGKVVELEHDLRLSDVASSWESAPRGLKLATLVAEFAEVLKGNYWAKDGDLAEVLRRARRLSPELASDERSAEMVTLVERAERLKRSVDPKSREEE